MYKINDTITEEIFVQDSNGDAVTGLVNADFTKELLKNKAATGETITVTENELGRYWVEFTPTATGNYQWFVSNATYQPDGWWDYYKVTTNDVDDNNTVIDRIETDTTSIESKVDTVDGIVDTINSTTSTTDGKVDTISGNVDTTLINLATVDTVVDRIETDTISIESKVDTVDTTVDGIQTDLSNSTDGLGAIKTAIDDLDFSSLETKVDTIDTVVDRIEVDTTSIEGKVNIIDTNVDSILLDTTSIESKVDIIDTNVDTALTDLTSIESKIDIIDTVLDATKVLVERVLGLSQEDYYIDTTVYDANENMTSCRIRTYSVAASVGTDDNVLATYTMTATYNSNQTMATYQLSKDD